MMGVIANLLLNGLIVVLLAVTIGYCWLLNRRIKVLQDSRSELALLLKHFDESTQRASESIIALQIASKHIGENIQLRIDKANYLLDDLTVMIEKGSKLANHIEAGFAVDRARSRVVAERSVAQDNTPVNVVDPLVEMEPLSATLRERPASAREKTSVTLEAVLGRVVGRSRLPEEGDRPVARERSQMPRIRSRSEQELLDMIKSGIKG